MEGASSWELQRERWLNDELMDTSEFDKVRNVPISQGIPCNKHNLDMCCSQCGSEPWKKYCTGSKGLAELKLHTTKLTWENVICPLQNAEDGPQSMFLTVSYVCWHCEAMRTYSSPHIFLDWVHSAPSDEMGGDGELYTHTIFSQKVTRSTLTTSW